MTGPLFADKQTVVMFCKKKIYKNWFMNHTIMRHCVFIDECGYNIWTARNHGGARQGERAYRQVCGQRGRNVTVALAVSTVNGLVFHSAYISGMNARRFNDFLAQTRQNLDPTRLSSFTTVRQHIEIPPSPRSIPSWRCSRPTAHC